MINSVTYVPELDVFATCSFDCNVYMWKNTDKCECVCLENGTHIGMDKVGSLVLGTGQAQNGTPSEAEKRRYAKTWQIKIDKAPRFKKDREEANELLIATDEMPYETMFMKGKPDQG